MDQLKSSNHSAAEIPLPRRSFGLEFYVGLFGLVSCAAAGYLAIGLAGMKIGPSSTYDVFAEFDNVSGLKYGASVEIGGVPIGSVSDIQLKDPMARVLLQIENSVQLRDDDILSIRTKGIIGDRYVKVSRGGNGEVVAPGATITETESVVDIEDVIGKIVHSLEKDDAKGDSEAPANPTAVAAVDAQ